MTLASFVIAVFPALLITAGITDFFTHTIPNVLTGAILLLFAVLTVILVLSGKPIGLSETGSHLLALAAGLVVGMALFVAKLAGGGDAKLLAVSALWLGWPMLVEYVFLSTIIGGVLSILLLCLRAVPLPSQFAAIPSLSRLTGGKADMPYGVALAAGALVVWPHSELFRQVMSP